MSRDSPIRVLISLYYPQQLITAQEAQEVLLIMSTAKKMAESSKELIQIFMKLLWCMATVSATLC